MKNIIITLITILITLTVSAQKSYDHFKIQVDGLGCPFCAYGLEKKFKEFKGLKKVIIDIESGNFEFDYPSEKQLTLNQVIDQVQEAGYTPKTATISRVSGTTETFDGSNNNEAVANQTSKKLVASGNCDMCKARIEASALNIDGITNALWNKETKELLFTSSKPISKEEVAKQIAKAGHDNEFYKSDKGTYESLPPCCSYRK